MPKGGKKSSRKSNVEIVADIKLSDFADTSARNGRLKKSIGNLNQDKLKDLSEEPLWYEKDLEDFKLLKVNSEDSKKKCKVREDEELIGGRPGVRYPPDVWFLVGGYIRPEQVRLFASICKDAYHVSRSYSFWASMYKRHLDPGASLPARLRPECVLAQPLCLRASVVRALHLCYPPLMRSRSPELAELRGLFCALAWRMPQPGGRWAFHFKFQPLHLQPAKGFGAAVQRLWAEGAGEEAESQVTHNPDAGCRILRFCCPHFVSVPPALVMGSRLEGATSGLASDMRAHRLRLSFKGGEVEFDAVEGLAVLHWWHPHFPFDYF